MNGRRIAARKLRRVGRWLHEQGRRLVSYADEIAPTEPNDPDHVWDLSTPEKRAEAARIMNERHGRL